VDSAISCHPASFSSRSSGKVKPYRAAKRDNYCRGEPLTTKYRGESIRGNLIERHRPAFVCWPRRDLSRQYCNTGRRLMDDMDDNANFGHYVDPVRQLLFVGDTGDQKVADWPDYRGGSGSSTAMSTR
jgi:hypothetical protein